MVKEKQKNLSTGKEVAIHKQGESNNFFLKLSVGNIYGEYTMDPKTRIGTDLIVPKDHPPRLTEEEKKSITQKYHIPSIGYIQLIDHPEGKQFVVTPGMSERVTEWAPISLERAAITAVARAVSDKELPYVVDVGCGNGFNSKLLAEESQLKILGIDPNLPEETHYSNENVELRKADIHDILNELGPIRDSQTTKQIASTLEKIRHAFLTLDDPFNAIFFKYLHDQRQKLENEIEELQRNADKYVKDSSVDVVLCSFMPDEIDLTLAIRDGIHPKAIIYAFDDLPRDCLDQTDFYQEHLRKNAGDLQNKVLRFNPGSNYETMAEWQTFYRRDWEYGQTGPIAITDGRVVVQIRKDVELNLPQNVATRAYEWDKDIISMIHEHRKKSSGYLKMDYYVGLLKKMPFLSKCSPLLLE